MQKGVSYRVYKWNGELMHIKVMIQSSVHGMLYNLIVTNKAVVTACYTIKLLQSSGH